MSDGRATKAPAWIAALVITTASTVLGAAGQAVAALSQPGHAAGVQRIAGTMPEWARPAAYQGSAPTTLLRDE